MIHEVIAHQTIVWLTDNAINNCMYSKKHVTTCPNLTIMKNTLVLRAHLDLSPKIISKPLYSRVVLLCIIDRCS